MKDNLKPVRGKKGPEELHNDQVAIERRDFPLCQMSPLTYDVYDLENYQCLGTCEVWYKKQHGRKTIVLKEIAQKSPIFSEILAVANQVVCK